MNAAVAKTATTVAAAGKTTAVGVVAQGEAAAKVGVEYPTSAVRVAATAEAEETRLGLVVEPDAAERVVSEEITRVVEDAALGAATVNESTAREAVPSDTGRRAPSARLRARARTTARSRWCRARGKRLPPWWTFHPPPCARVNCE